MSRKAKKSAMRPRLPARLREGLAQAPESFDFFATMRALERHNRSAPRIGDNETLREEYVSLAQDPYLAFPDSNVAKAEEVSPERMRLFVRFLGLLGPQGALPLSITDEAQTYLSRGDDAFARFLDLFNNRFLQLFFRAWADARPIAQADRPDQDRFRAYIGSSIGIGSPLAKDIDALPDAIKLHFAGLMGANAKSASRIASLVSGTFRVTCEVEEFVGSWLPLPKEERSQLGLGNMALGGTPTSGGTVMLGERTFSVSDKFRLRLSMRSLGEYETFLPIAKNGELLSDLVIFHLGETLEWEVELALPAREAKPMVLGKAGRLGWTSWMAPDWAEDPEAMRCDARFNVQARVKEHRARPPASGKAA